MIPNEPPSTAVIDGLENKLEIYDCSEHFRYNGERLFSDFILFNLSTMNVRWQLVSI